MNKYTVVGYYVDNSQPYVGWVNSESPQDASLEVPVEVVVVEVFEGHHKGCLDNGSVLGADERSQD